MTKKIPKMTATQRNLPKQYLTFWLQRSLVYSVVIMLVLFTKRKSTMWHQPLLPNGLDDSSKNPSTTQHPGQELVFVTEESSWLFLQNSFPVTTKSTPFGDLDWKNLVTKPLVYEIGGIVLFHFLGVPFVTHISRLLQFASKIHSLGAKSNMLWRGAVKTKIAWRATQKISSKSTGASSSAQTTASLLKQVKKSATKLFKKRSRLSVASEFGNFVGLEDEDEDRDETSSDATSWFF